MPKHQLWICRDRTTGILCIVDAVRAYDVREAARKRFKLPTYDGIEVQAAPPMAFIPPKTRVITVDYIGSAMNHTLERVEYEVTT